MNSSTVLKKISPTIFIIFLIFVFVFLGKVCTLRESGLSLTKPSVHSHSQVVMSEDNESFLSDKIMKKEGEKEEEVEVDDLESGGEGMEWHSDGSKGEFTMLLSFKGRNSL